jgi:D-alanyl-D-alanine carboxypeptidase
VLLALTLTLGTACRSADPPAPVAPASTLARELQALLDRAVAEDPALPGAMLHVDAPRLRLSFDGAAGVVDRATAEPLTPRHPVRIASNTKTFVAAAILRLHEDGKLELDSSLARHVAPEHLALLEGEGYDPEAITLRHLLTHTSGLFDYATSDFFSQRVEADPGHRWTRTEQVRAAMEWGEPYGRPGEVYRYADTGYILLGEVLERTTGQPLAAALREQLDFDALGLTSTWLESLEAVPAGVPARAHQYLGETDTYGWDPSLDLYGGGGLAATVGDLARFVRALFAGRAFRSAETAKTMLTTVAAERGGPVAYGQEQTPGTYRMGIAVSEIDGLEVYQHTGFWGTTAAYVPQLDLAIGLAVTQQGSPAQQALFRQALDAVRAANRRVR